MTNLTPDQFNQLKRNFCIEVADNMDMETLLEIAFNQLMQSYDDLNQEDMKEEIVNYYGDSQEEYNTMINQIKPLIDYRV